MPKMCIALSGISIFAVIFLGAVPVFARGDKVIPQMADGQGVIRTKFDITNLSPRQRITKVKVLFFHQDGSAWTIATNQGTASEIPLSLGLNQTIRIETLANTPVQTAGYAIVRNSETTNSTYADDFEVSVSVYYEILSGSNVVDTVSVPVGDPTVSWIFPVEIDLSRSLYTGFAIVNLSNSTN